MWGDSSIFFLKQRAIIMRAWQINSMIILFSLNSGLCTVHLQNDHKMLFYLFEIIIYLL